jgi:hypothetical protein
VPPIDAALLLTDGRFDTKRNCWKNSDLYMNIKVRLLCAVDVDNDADSDDGDDRCCCY